MSQDKEEVKPFVETIRAHLMQQRAVTAIRLIAVLYLAFGIAGIAVSRPAWKMVQEEDAFTYSIKLNSGVFSVLAGLALLRPARGWRTFAVLLNAYWLVVLTVLLVDRILQPLSWRLLFSRTPLDVSLHGASILSRVPIGVAVAVIIPLLAVQLWIWVSLQRADVRAILDPMETPPPLPKQ